MSNWRKQQHRVGEGHHHQVGQWSRSSSYNRKPPLDSWQPTVPRWERMFCASVGLVPWQKVVETQKYLYLHENVMNWDDSAVREAFDNAKRRFWLGFNGLPCNIPLPDPNMYIDDIDWNARVDVELVLDLESEAKALSEGEKDENVVILDSAFILNQSFYCTGWGEAEADTPKHTDLFPGSQDNQPENYGADSWEQYVAPYDAAAATREYEWKDHGNDSWVWNQRQHYHSDTHEMGKGSTSWNKGTGDGYTRRGGNISWYKPPAYHGGGHQMNRGTRNNRGRKGGNFVYVPKVNEVTVAKDPRP